MAKPLQKWRIRGYTIAAGVLLAIGHAPISVPIGVALGLPVLAALLLRVTSTWQGFKLGWLAGTAYFAASMFWIVEPFFVEPEIYGWMAPFALIFLSVGLALFWASGFALAARAEGWVRLPLLVVGLTLAEFARAFIFTGFPWGLLAYVWSETPVFQLLSWVGPHGLGLLTVFVGVMPMAFSRRWLRGVAIMVGLMALWGAGFALQPSGAVPVRDVTLRLVQPNAPQHLKWHPDHIVGFFERGLALSEGDGVKVDAVVWPETALPFRFNANARGLEMLRDAVDGTHFIGGTQRAVDGEMYNAMVHLGTSGELVASYDKSHLVPFGEYIPFASFAERFGIFGMADVNQMGCQLSGR